MASIKPVDIKKTLNVDFCCVSCGSTENLTVDHVFPKSRGGADHVANYQIMCKTHNESKKNYIDYSFEYIDVIKISEIYTRLFRDERTFSHNYKHTLLEKCFGKKLTGNELLTKKEFGYMVDYFKMYGINLEFYPKTRKVIKDRIKFFIETNPDYTLPKHMILKLLEKKCLTFDL